MYGHSIIMMSQMRAALDRSSPLPLWAQLVDELRRRLAEGDLSGRLPTEPRLAADYGVSRQTVREAIRRLRDTGLLTAERGRGTFVREAAPAPPTEERAGSLLAAIEAPAAGRAVTVRVLDRATEARAAERLGLPADAALVHLERLWSSDGTPVAHDRTWLPEAVGEPLLDSDLRRVPLREALERWCGLRVDGGSERLSLAAPTGEPRRLLGLEKRQPALLVERLGRAGDRPVEWGETLVRGDRRGLRLEWSPAGGGWALDG
jgi:GntR family transcriptional regulator